MALAELLMTLLAPEAARPDDCSGSKQRASELDILTARPVIDVDIFGRFHSQHVRDQDTD